MFNNFSACNTLFFKLFEKIGKCLSTNYEILLVNLIARILPDSRKQSRSDLFSIFLVPI